MKLFIWNSPYQVAYGGSLVFAVAASVDEAREIARSKSAPWYVYGEFADGDDYEGDKTLYRSCPPELGEPTRVLDLPCCEWHKWEE